MNRNSPFGSNPLGLGGLLGGGLFGFGSVQHQQPAAYDLLTAQLRAQQEANFQAELHRRAAESEAKPVDLVLRPDGTYGPKEEPRRLEKK
ncbi:MAG: hypothetical protein GY906_24290 [bacterium]|nr:hypothetical protein [bacterium]